MFEAAGGPLEKADYFLLAEATLPGEIHPEIIEVLDAIAVLVGDPAGDVANQ